MISTKLDVFSPASLRKQVAKACVIRKGCFVDRRRQMAMSCGKKTSSVNGHDDTQICGQKIFRFVAQQFIVAIIGCQKTNFPCCVFRQKAVFCGQNG